MPAATFNGVVIAESDHTIVVEGNHYFPKDSVKWDYLSESSARQTVCPWKGLADYYDLEVDGEQARGVAWTYHEPKSEAAQI
ncbi:MAG: DUF427 domain-containing protein, partial [Acidimicrobiia bacterium]|nr:DUF427 domain-containing protein [Acidimicrobiia bacterium]